MEHCARRTSVYNLPPFKYLLIAGKIDIYIDPELVSAGTAEFEKKGDTYSRLLQGD